MKPLSEIKGMRKPWKYDRIIGVYFLFLQDHLVYVGRSIDCIGRMVTHSKDKEFDSYSILEMSKDLLDKSEMAYIKELKPKLNKSGNEKPVSLFPLSLSGALKGLLETKPPPPECIPISSQAPTREEQKLLYIDENNRQEELGYYTNPFRGVINAINE